MTHRTADEPYKGSQRDSSSRRLQSPPPSYAGYAPPTPQPYQTDGHQQSYQVAPAQAHYQQGYAQGYELPAKNQGGYGQQPQPQPQVVYVQTPPGNVVVRNQHHTKDDVALGFCAGCATACCCCGCTVM